MRRRRKPPLNVTVLFVVCCFQVMFTGVNADAGGTELNVRMQTYARQKERIVPSLSAPNVNIADRPKGRQRATRVFEGIGMKQTRLAAQHRCGIFGDPCRQTLWNRQQRATDGRRLARHPARSFAQAIADHTRFSSLQWKAVIVQNSEITLIAEAGVNHHDDPEKVLPRVDATGDAGIDLIRFKTFSAKSMATRSAALADYRRQQIGSAKSALDMRLELAPEEAAHHRLIGECASCSTGLLSPLFDLVGLDPPTKEPGQRLLKTGPGDLNNGPLPHAAAQAGCDVMQSNGMSDPSHSARTHVPHGGFFGMPSLFDV